MNKTKSEVIHDCLKEGFEQAGYLADISELYSEMADCIKKEGLSEEETDSICYDENNAFKPESMINHIVRYNESGIRLIQNNLEFARIDTEGAWKPTDGVRSYLNRCLNIIQNRRRDTEIATAKNNVMTAIIDGIDDEAIRNTVKNILTSDYNSINWLKAEHDLKIWKGIDKDMQTIGKGDVQTEKDKAVSKGETKS